MSASEQCVVVSGTGRLQREECVRTKHDSDFSEWKVLIGPSDWEDHSQGKEGAEKYRVHNLPNCSSSCPGLYELGIAVPCTRSGREAASSKLYPDRIIPVYLGQADSVRARLQHYGRDGAHLENGNSSIGQLNLNDSVQQGLRLFSDIFSRGYPIVYRWAPMKSKRDAEKMETRLLDKFDYAWNRGNNCVRRHNYILQKLDRSTSAKMLYNFHQKKIGIKVDTCNLLLLENGSNKYTNQESNDFLSRILKIGRSQPRPVSLSFGFNEDNTRICGVALSHGSVCRRPPVEGRKRCAEHKWMKVNGLESSIVISDPECDGHWAPSFSHCIVKPKLIADNFPLSKGSFPICGITLDDGSLCRMQPIQGRKRCEEHKGRKIKGSSLSESQGKQQYIHGPVLKSSTYATNDYEQISLEHPRKSHRPHSPVFSESCVIKKKLDAICGVDLEDGTFCTRQPVIGRKRCDEHKWMRVNDSKSKLPVADLPSTVFDDGSGISSCNGRKYDNDSCQSATNRSVVNKDFSSTCGATLVDGSSCSRPPAEGRRRCWQHVGKRENNSSKSKLPVADLPSVFDGSGIGSCNGRKYDNDSCQSATHRSVVNKDFSSTCGATLVDGSSCRRPPAQGRKRCWQHVGKRENNGSKSKLPVADLPSVFDGSGIGSCNGRKYDNDVSQSATHRSVVNKDFSATCGATLVDGCSSCSRPPAEGRKRCWQHEGKRENNVSKSKLPVADLPSVFDGSGIGSCYGRKYDNDSSQSATHRSVVNKGFSSTCGATLVDGSSCSRPPAEGRKRCWQHEGKRENNGSSYNFTSMYGGSSSNICGASLQNGSICYSMPVHGRKRCEQHKGMWASSGISYDFTPMYGGISSDICGAPLRNGSICSRMPVHGRKRCEQHKGRRAAF